MPPAAGGVEGAGRTVVIFYTAASPLRSLCEIPRKTNSLVVNVVSSACLFPDRGDDIRCKSVGYSYVYVLRPWAFDVFSFKKYLFSMI